mmetsp:Transcript_13539/g.47145  ORF Transcript_13539/g.47145 Transcript_13539/m.47145 type:complete len:227 (-) Transcript_13539:142-822(-)
MRCIAASTSSSSSAPMRALEASSGGLVGGASPVVEASSRAFSPNMADRRARAASGHASKGRSDSKWILPEAARHRLRRENLTSKMTRQSSAFTIATPAQDTASTVLHRGAGAGGSRGKAVSLLYCLQGLEHEGRGLGEAAADGRPVAEGRGRIAQGAVGGRRRHAQTRDVGVRAHAGVRLADLGLHIRPILRRRRRRLARRRRARRCLVRRRRAGGVWRPFRGRPR